MMALNGPESGMPKTAGLNSPTLTQKHHDKKEKHDVTEIQ